MKVSAILPTRNPHSGRLEQVLRGLAQQDLPATDWELVVVDNASDPPIAADSVRAGPAGVQVVREPRPGLLWARAAGMRHAAGAVLFFLDDDTVPAPSALREAHAFMAEHPDAATAGGRVLASFEVEPPAWIEAAAWALAVRDWGDQPRCWAVAEGGGIPNWTPIGAGLTLRREAVPAYLEHLAAHGDAIEQVSWHGQGSGGNEDVDLVLQLLRAGWATGYAPRVALTHLIPAHRLTAAYLSRLVVNLNYLWMRTLHAHGFDLYPPVAPATVPFRKLKAWLAFRSWRGMRQRLQWLVSCGRLDGLAANYRDPTRYPAFAPVRSPGPFHA